MTEQSLAELKKRISELEAENATLLHQHGNDDAANRMLVVACDGHQKTIRELRQQILDSNEQK